MSVYQTFVGNPIPDNAGGRTYFQDTFATVDGWTGSSFTASVSGGVLIETKTAANATAYKNFGTSIAAKILRLKVGINSGTPSDSTLTVQWRTSGDVFISSSTATINTLGAWSFVDFTAPATAQIIRLFVGSYAGADIYAIKIDWCYVGDATYVAGTFPWTDISDLVEVPSIKKTTRMMTELRPNSNTCEFRAIFSSTLFQSAIAATSPVPCYLYKDYVPYFTGMLSPNYQAQIRNGAKFLSFIAEDYTLQVLSKTIAAITTFAGYAPCTPAATATSMVHAVATACGITLASGLPTISTAIPYILIFPEDHMTYAQLLADILFEYNYVYAFNDDGTMTLIQAVNTGAVTTTNNFTVHASTGNVLGQIEARKTPEKYDDVRINFQTVEARSSIVLFQDVANAAPSVPGSCSIALAANGDAGKKDYYPFGSDVGEVFCNWQSPDGLNIWIATTCALDTVVDGSITLTRALTNYYRKASFAYRNGDGTVKYISRMRLVGDAYITTSRSIARSTLTGGKQILNYDAKYIFDTTSATALARLINQYYLYSDLTFTIKSKSVFALGEYVLLADSVYSGISAKCRIVGKLLDESSSSITYQLEAVADFASITITIDGSNASPTTNAGAIYNADFEEIDGGDYSAVLSDYGYRLETDPGGGILDGGSYVAGSYSPDRLVDGGLWLGG